MKRIHVVFLALFVLSATAAFAASTASAFVSLLPETATVEGKLTAPGKLANAEGLQITCSAGSLLKVNLKLNEQFHVHYTGCKGPLNEACESLGDASEVILSLGESHLVFDSLSPLGVGIALLLEPVHIECLGFILVLILVEKSCVLGLVEKINSAVTVNHLVFKETSGKQSEQTYWNSAGKEEKCIMKESKNGGASEEGGIEGNMETTSSAAVEVMG